ncbi:hypothetical protein EDB81DRAFT_647242, partial [Dactylonectria macrodidyma]
GIDVHAQSGFCGNALQAVSLGGHTEILLFANKPNLNTQGGFYRNALYAALFKSHTKI